MAKCVIRLLIAVALATTLSLPQELWADHDSDSHDQLQTTIEVELDPNKDPEKAIEQLVARFHGHEHGKMSLKERALHSAREFIRKARSVRAVGDLKRLYDLGSYQRLHDLGPEQRLQLGDHIANLPILYGASHLFETLSGPVGGTIASSLGASDAVVRSIWTVGGIIAIPGLDVVCIGLAAAYTFPSFRNGVTKIRLRLTRVAKWMVGSQLAHWQSAVPLLESLATAGGETLAVDDTGIFISPKPVGIHLTYERKNGFLWLSRVAWNTNSPEERRAAWKELKPFLDLNSRHVIKKLLKEPPKLPPYVRYRGGDESFPYYQLEAGAIQPWGHMAWNDCSNLLL